MADLFATTLNEAIYEGIAFPVGECQVDGGHDSVEHTAYRRPGADIEPTGLKAYRGTLSVPLINDIPGYGTLFPDLYRALTNKFETTPIGQMQHPSIGKLPAVAITTWKATVSPSVRNGVILHVEWVEHSDPGALSQSSRTSPHATRDTPTASQTQADQCDADMTAADSTASFTPLSNLFATQLAFLEAQFRTYGEITAAVQVMVDAVAANLSLPAFATPASHTAVVALEALRASTYALRDRYLGTQERPRLYTVPRTMPVFQIAYEVYGDASDAGLITAANAIPDPFFVPQGTVLTILPAR